MEILRNLPFSSIADALEYQAQIRPEKSAILYPDPNTNSTEYASLTYRHYNNITNYLAQQISKYLPSYSSNVSMTCGLLAVGGIEYLLAQYSLLKIPNVIMFPISARNSQAAVEHLLKETKTTLLLTTSQYLPMIKLIQEQEEFQHLKILFLDSDEFKIQELLKNKDIKFSMTSNIIAVKEKNDEELNKVVVILHSSGSTAHPKPIRLTNRYLLMSFFLYSSINKDFSQEDDVTLSWGALFHLLAFNGTVRAILIGSTYALPLCESFPPKPDELLRNIQIKNGITTLITVPSFLEQLIRELRTEKNNHIGFKPLQKLKFIMYGGAGCPDEFCKILVDNGVVLISVYGATETGVVMVKNFNPYDKIWKSMQIPPIRKAFLRVQIPENTQNQNERIFVHLPNDPFLAENISNTSDGCYISSDILLRIEGPPNSEEYLVLGRQDETLVHINGEKTNPLPMENIIRHSPFIQQVVIIGHNQFCTAALIQLNVKETENYEINQIEENIWKVIEQANKDAPTHSRLVRQLVHILATNETLPVTDKGNLMRQRVNQQYATLISTIYDKFFNQQNLNKVTMEKEEIKWTKETIKKYLEDMFKSLFEDFDSINMNSSSKSIFDFGINSLQVLQLRNLICQDICQIPENFLYEYSSFDKIIEQLNEYLTNRNIANPTTDPYHYELTEQIIDKYINLIKENPILTMEPQLNKNFERVFLVTGANGSLGSFIIQDLLKQPRTIVKRVYCLLRGSDPKQRLFEAFKQRQLEISLLKKSLEEVEQRLIILPGSMNLSEEYLGQGNDIYHQLQVELTDIIHSAWKMNFNQTVKDFEYDSIFGVYNLLKLASSNNIQFHFLSSISSVGSGLLSNIEEKALPRKPQIALSQGYGQSKYVSEHICSAAYHLWNVPVNIYRIGQISGDTKNGVWNPTEMAAMMIYAGAGQLKKMPNIGQDINWIPVDICSSSLIDLALKSSSDTSLSIDERIYHLLNPNTIKYEDYLFYLRQVDLSFECVPPKDFIETILKTADTKNPLIKLSSFFEQIFTKKDFKKMPTYETIKTTEKCEILRNCPHIDSNLIKLYLNYWKKCQLLK